MEEYIYIGKIVNTHGIKGEIRILSDFEKKDSVFVVGMPIYIGRKKEKEIIKKQIELSRILEEQEKVYMYILKKKI